MTTSYDRARARLAERTAAAVNGDASQFAIALSGIDLDDLVRKIYSGLADGDELDQMVENARNVTTNLLSLLTSFKHLETFESKVASVIILMAQQLTFGMLLQQELSS